jgi:hypothetical protein
MIIVRLAGAIVVALAAVTASFAQGTAPPPASPPGIAPPGQGAEPRQRPNTQRTRLFPEGRCAQTQAAIAIGRGEVGVMTQGALETRNRDGALGYIIGEGECRVRVFIAPEPAARSQPDRRAPAVPHQEPFRR